MAPSQLPPPAAPPNLEPEVGYGDEVGAGASTPAGAAAARRALSAANAVLTAPRGVRASPPPAFPLDSTLISFVLRVSRHGVSCNQLRADAQFLTLLRLSISAATSVALPRIHAEFLPTGSCATLSLLRKLLPGRSRVDIKVVVVVSALPSDPAMLDADALLPTLRALSAASLMQTLLGTYDVHATARLHACTRACTNAQVRGRHWRAGGLVDRQALRLVTRCAQAGAQPHPRSCEHCLERARTRADVHGSAPSFPLVWCFAGSPKAVALGVAASTVAMQQQPQLYSGATLLAAGAQPASSGGGSSSSSSSSSTFGLVVLVCLVAVFAAASRAGAGASVERWQAAHPMLRHAVRVYRTLHFHIMRSISQAHPATVLKP
ncbi:MAG: hypothetical protein EOO41_02070 [Methanobacteriota archaeon]|nr:MAG: hypothetical protein EOO41_02070 [Euryarchaeota archaeon]